MKAGYTKIALTLWLAMWILSMYYEVGFRAAAAFGGILMLTVLLAYQAGRGDGAWK